MRFLLDAKAVIALVRGSTTLQARVERHPPSEFAISVIAAHEVYYGSALSARQAQTLAVANQLLFAVLDFGREDARAAADIRARLKRIGRPIGPFDALIAGQALARRLTLITHNTREFSRVEGLAIEDWEV